MHDGPGMRTTVFLKGCPLHCAWCHNPETQAATSELLLDPKRCIVCRGCTTVCPMEAHCFEKEHTVDRSLCTTCFACAQSCPTGALSMCGKELSIEEILKTVQKDEAFYGARGGVTLSGGEPFLQGVHTVALLEACKKHGLTTAVETSGYTDPEVLRAAISFVDLFLWDIKDTDEARHLRYTGVSNRRILDNLHLADQLGARIRLRCILVGGVNTDAEHYRAVATLASTLSCLEGVELIPYHAYAGSKATLLGRDDNGNPDWIPSPIQLDEARRVLESSGVTII